MEYIDSRNMSIKTSPATNNIYSVQFQEFSLDMYFRQFWNDPRLAFKKLNSNIDRIVLSAGNQDNKFWEPDTFFVNAKDLVVHKDPNKNEFVRILPEGDILLSRRQLLLTIRIRCRLYNVFIILEWLFEINIYFLFFRVRGKFSCPMNLQYFPMDSQLCYIEIESCKKSTLLIILIFVK